MPQDSVTFNNGNGTVYTQAYDSLPPQMKHFVDSVSGGTVQVDKFTKKSNEYSNLALPLTLLLLLGTWLLVKYFSTNPFHLKVDDDDEDNSASQSAYPLQSAENPDPVHVYEGAGLNCSSDEVAGILSKRFPYFNTLGIGEQQRFLLRHKKFMRDKIFNIHSGEGFKEMPILISAAAIQLSFGLEHYMLPAYPFINIFPQEFIRTDTYICFLEGNVSGNNIKISWKHFLEGYSIPDDGDNVGLHEMAHAYYCQNLVCGEDTDPCFIKGFPAFNESGTKAFEAEQAGNTDFYSDYAVRNLQEFWAESVERFFERPAEMKSIYPEVYRSLSILLNQSPA